MAGLCWYWECVDFLVRRFAFQASGYQPAVVLGGVGTTAVWSSIVDAGQISTTIANRAEAAFFDKKIFFSHVVKKTLKAMKSSKYHNESCIVVRIPRHTSCCWSILSSLKDHEWSRLKSNIFQASTRLINPYLRLVDHSPPSIHISVDTIHTINCPDPKRIRRQNTRTRSIGSENLG